MLPYRILYSKYKLIKGSSSALSQVSSSFFRGRLSTVVSDELPKSTSRVGQWIFGLGGLVAGMVTVGGITRLTRSGLSMTDWKLQGSLPPITLQEWETEFDRYKKYPEWQQRKTMTLSEFKFIYFWEYGHRMMGRFIGVAFVVPFTYFSVRGQIPRSLYSRLGLLFSLGGAQGLIGWWMVRSGLEMDPAQRKEIRVSPYRLATHLGMAFTTFTLLLWTGLDLMNPVPAVQAALTTATQNQSTASLRAVASVRSLAIVTGVLVATTVLSGAFVAGNDAGRAYNTFPDMDGRWVPAEVLDLTPLWRNAFENTATVQFDHRVLALVTVVAATATYALAARRGTWPALPASSRMYVRGVAGMACAQAALGVSTLLLYVPVPLAAVHQAGSLVLLTLVTCLVHSLKHSGVRRLASTGISSGSKFKSL